MPEQDVNNDKPYVGDVGEATVSLSQAILAPLDALFKAQIHAARSFLNLLLQIGYPHNPVNANAPDAAINSNAPGEPFELEFKYSGTDQATGLEKEYVMKVPALALVPLNSLAIDSAEFKFGLNITRIDEHEQIQKSRSNKENTEDPKTRPWFLVSHPISMQGTISSNSSGKQNLQSQTSIDVSVKISKSPIPAALDNLLTTLTQSANIKSVS